MFFNSKVPSSISRVQAKLRLIQKMPTQLDFIKDITISKMQWKLKVRVVRMWEVPDRFNPGTIFSIELVLQDETGKQERKAMDKERDVKPDIMEQQKTELDELIGGETEYKIGVPEAVLEKPDILGEVSYVSNSLHIVPEVAHPDFRDSDASPVNCDTDISKMHPSIETTCCRLNGLSAPQNMPDGTSPYVMNVNSSTCSTYSILPIVTTGLSSNDKDQSKSIRDVANFVSKAHSQKLDDLPEVQQQMLKKVVTFSFYPSSIYLLWIH